MTLIPGHIYVKNSFMGVGSVMTGRNWFVELSGGRLVLGHDGHLQVGQTSGGTKSPVLPHLIFIDRAGGLLSGKYINLEVFLHLKTPSKSLSINLVVSEINPVSDGI